MPQLIAAGDTHQGCVRRRNEDNFCCVSLFPGYLLAAVADGVGGHVGGEVASYLCCHRLILDWKKLFRRISRPDNARLARLLADTIQRANADIFRANLEHKHAMPMCTTLAAAIFTDDMVIVGHAGDSRVYCLRGNSCRKLTVDHTVANELQEQGLSDKRYMPGNHVISQALGATKRIKPEIHSYFRTASDRFLLCTDGLSNHLRTEELAECLAAGKHPREVNHQLLRTTLCRGAVDNVTVISVLPQTD